MTCEMHRHVSMWTHKSILRDHMWNAWACKYVQLILVNKVHEQLKIAYIACIYKMEYGVKHSLHPFFKVTWQFQTSLQINTYAK